MNIYINGNAFELLNAAEPHSIDKVLAKILPLSQQQQSFALALNGDFVGQADYCNTHVSSNDSIDLLFPIVGG
ncbi:sulfur carrier protein ThiS [Colwellia sp. MB3u-70]|uniref:sulfur carrier protein ThiS n=1 Tax=unclassified Colwellia TaxID=196834 RepID=UPI0015F69F13|nr:MULTISPECIES: sulfur carrier protein ThiS [unclassified Colwellia]MBA6291978.1 sulfur carrier protein ThiS [Colwellia sp. MB3u-8]MBA6308622.1 sulfur carrier protein ThiS [Colwellia sp. MB3u-70]